MSCRTDTMLPYDPISRAEADATFARGLDAWASGDIKEASRLFRATLRKNPRHVDAWNHLALAALGRGRVKEAEERFLRAFEVGRREFEVRGTAPRCDDPVGRAWFEARKSLALIEARRRNHAEAAARLEQLLRDDPDDTLNVRWRVGEFHHRAGALDRAIEAYRRAPEEPGSRFGLALALHARGDEDAVGAAMLRAFVANRYIAPMLLSEPWRRLEGYHPTNMAEPEWARAYVERCRPLWKSTPGAAKTLREAWHAPTVREWRRALDALATRLSGAEGAARSEVLDEWVELITDDAIAVIVRALRQARFFHGRASTRRREPPLDTPRPASGS